MIATEARQQEFLLQQGYLRVRDVFDSEQVERTRRSIFEFFGLNPETARCIGGLASGKSWKRYDAVRTFPEAMEMATDKKLLDRLENILGPNIVLSLNRHNHASVNPPGASTEGIHRDHGEPTRGLLSAIVYLENADPDNGCTHVIPGSHLWATSGRAQNGGYWLEDSPFGHMADQAVPIPMSAGDVLLFDGHIYHGVGANTADRTRTSLALGYHSVDQLMSEGAMDPNKLLLVRGEDIYRGNDR